MTYCVALRLQDGMVFAGDTRTNAGIDHISTFKKLYTFGKDGERSIMLLTSGNLATSQAVVKMLENGILQGTEPNLLDVPTLFDAAQLVGDLVSKVARTTQTRAYTQEGFGSNFLLGGQIKGQQTELYHIYSEGNCINATEDTPYLQIGEAKYGKPILDRSLNYRSSLEDAVRAVLVSFDSTIRSNLSVGFPIDLIVYRNDTYTMPAGIRVTENEPYMNNIRSQWSAGLKAILQQFEEPPADYFR
ncbi:peptidase [Neisseria dentiae]|uniref:Peptidase n=1 Tax=Neisseria dentiae TaxID=194197 RepID=A0A1X3DGA0_9NEIS|nr:MULTISPECIES: peptidase [Neisseria]MDO4226110.1 peptidase [Neisseria sp.]OSI18734.1 peptidase [Neisseria dentiae]QMT46269.1 peptidase [Neisseria dentiae]STZ52431.1 Proteasome subunit [Neisseria dentiae]